MANTAVLYESDIEEDPTRLNPDAEDSDTESLADLQSPADGYFEQRSHPRQTFVENDPTSKAKEAEIERSRDAESRTEVRSGGQQLRWADDSMPALLDAGPAPPDYEAATADRRRAQQEQQSFRSDHPLVRNGLLGEHGVFNSRGQQPESMTQPQPGSRPPEVPAQERNYRDAVEAEEQPDETHALLNRPGREHRKKQRSWFSRCMKSCCMLFGVLLLVIVAIIATQATLKPHNDYDRGDGGGSQGGRYRKAPENDPTPPHPSHAHGCSLDSFSRTRWIGFESITKDFELLELIDSTSYRHLFPAGARIGGTIQISPALQDQEQDVKVWVNIATSRPVSIEDLNFDIKENYLEVVFPDVDVGRGGDVSRKEVCFDIAVAIHVKKGTKVRNWRMSTAHLGLVVDEGVFGKEEKDVDMFDNGLKVENSTEIFAVSGDVDVAYWSSRRTIVETLSGDIEGTFALRDLLVLTSKSGHIDAEVEPKKADEVEAVPAEFIMKSLSGYVHAEFPTNRNDNEQEAIPDRDYKVRVETKSGDISGTYILGQSAKFSALSGDLDLGIMPYSANLSNSHLQTDVVSGTTRVQLFEPYHADSFDTSSHDHRSGIIDALHSHHKSLSGEMELIYPQEWEGKIDGETISGNIKLRGKDVEVLMDSETPGLGKRVIGRKGTGHSNLKFETTSGDVDLLVGEDLVFSKKVFSEAIVG